MENIPVSIITPLGLGFTCEELFYALCRSGNYGYMAFLDSSLVPNKYSKFSYLLFEPDFVLKSTKKCNEIIYPGSCDTAGEKSFKKDFKQNYNFLRNFSGHIILKNSSGKYLVKKTNKISSLNNQGAELKKITSSENPPDFLKNILASCINVKSLKFYCENESLQKARTASGPEAMPDFTGGLTGFISYDYKDYLEKLPKNAIDDQGIPIFYFQYFSRLLAFSHTLNKWFMINNYEIEPPSGIDKKSIYNISNTMQLTPDIEECIFNDLRIKKNRLGKIIRSIEVLKKEKIANHIAEKYSLGKTGKLDLESNFDKDEYIEAINKAKKYIHEGDIYQVNMTQRFKCGPEVKPYDLYFILRGKNAAPFSAYLSFPDIKIGSSSPERFLFLKGSRIETRPIKGTRPRGKNPAEDAKFINELENSVKDHAELNMIVDLERNDLGKFCKYGTVKVKEHAVVEKYAKVFHLVSTVTGQLQEGYDIADILKAAFPGGSITGAPKIRAMEIIDELEPVTRGVYTGAIGYIGKDGTMDLNIVIRTFIIKDGIFYYNAGGGIVEDSSAEEEYQETLDKGLALKETLEYFTAATKK